MKTASVHTMEVERRAATIMATSCTLTATTTTNPQLQRENKTTGENISKTSSSKTNINKNKKEKDTINQNFTEKKKQQKSLQF